MSLQVDVTARIDVDLNEIVAAIFRDDTPYAASMIGDLLIRLVYTGEDSNSLSPDELAEAVGRELSRQRGRHTEQAKLFIRALAAAIPAT